MKNLFITYLQVHKEKWLGKEIWIRKKEENF